MWKNNVRILAVLLCCLALVFTAAALEPTDYGYYDANDDGKTELVDVLLMLRALVNGESDIPLLRVIRTVRASTDADVVSGTLTAVADGTFTLKKSDSTLLSVPAAALGIYAGDDLTSYVGFPATLSHSVTDADKLYAAKVDRARNGVAVATAGSTAATVNGASVTLEAAPFAEGGTLLVPAQFAAEALSATLAWDGVHMTFAKEGRSRVLLPTVKNGTSFVPLAALAEAFSDTAAWDAESGTLTVIAVAKATVAPEAVTAHAGESVEIPLIVKDSPGVTGLQFYISYDPALLTYSGTKGGNSGMHLQSSSAGACPVKVVLANLSLKEKLGTFTAAKLTFTVPEGTPAGTYTIDITQIDAYDKDVIAVPIVFSDITVTVE